MRTNEVGAPVNRIVAEAVLTPRHKDLEAGTWTGAAAAHEENLARDQRE